MNHLNVLAIGASRNIGYFSSIRLLELGATVTFLLRKPEVFDDDETMQRYVRERKAKLVQGDALVKEDVASAWEIATGIGGGYREVDFLLFTVGGTPHFSLTKGFFISPPNLVTQALHNALSTLPSPHPKVITISTAGLTHEGHKKLPLLVKPLYSYLLPAPHADKCGAEEVLAYSAGWSWERVDSPGEEILGSDFSRGLPVPGSLKAVTIRPALLTDGPCKEKYRAGEGDIEGIWTISRRDVAHFVVEKVMRQWDEWEGKRVSIAY